MGHREADEAAGRVQAELIEQMNPMRVDRSTADVQPIGDLKGWETPPDQAHNFTSVMNSRSCLGNRKSFGSRLTDSATLGHSGIEPSHGCGQSHSQWGGYV